MCMVERWQIDRFDEQRGPFSAGGNIHALQYRGLDSTAASCGAADDDDEDEEEDEEDDTEADESASIGAAPHPGRLPAAHRCAKSSEQRASSVGIAYSGRMRAWNEHR